MILPRHRIIWLWLSKWIFGFQYADTANLGYYFHILLSRQKYQYLPDNLSFTRLSQLLYSKSSSQNLLAEERVVIIFGKAPQDPRQVVSLSVLSICRPYRGVMSDLSPVVWHSWPPAAGSVLSSLENWEWSRLFLNLAVCSSEPIISFISCLETFSEINFYSLDEHFLWSWSLRFAGDALLSFLCGLIVATPPNYSMQRFKSFLLKAFNSDSEIKFWCLVFIITFDSFIFFALFSVAMKLENYVCKNENTFLNDYSQLAHSCSCVLVHHVCTFLSPEFHNHLQ